MTPPSADTPFTWHMCHSVDEMQAFYLSRLPAIREAARKCGYAVGLHGSTRRDFDLIAVPWIVEFAPKDILAQAIHRAACGICNENYKWTPKPNGRWAVSLAICWPEWEGCYDILSLGYIDLSVASGA